MAVVVRAATLSDARDIARLTIQLGYELDEATAAERLSRLLPREDQRFLVALVDGGVAGWLHVALAECVETGAFAVIAGLVVDRVHRREGVGRMLMDEAEHWAADRGCPVVRLWSTAARTAAHRFYERLGYRKVKTQYSFVKVLGASTDDLSRFVPRVEP